MEAKLQELCKGKTVMLAGCGGGCDCFGAMLIYHQIKPYAKKVLFGNLSFTRDRVLAEAGQKITSDCFKMSPYTDKTKLAKDCQQYGHYAEALMATYTGEPVYCFRHESSVGGYSEAYTAILEHEGLMGDIKKQKAKTAATAGGGGGAAASGGDEAYAYQAYQKPALDLLFLVDGGCDALLTGMESGGWGTPVEDMMHIRGVQMMEPGLIGSKYVAAIGANVDLAHGVWQSDLDQRLDDLINKFGAATFEPFLFTKDHPSAKYYIEGVSQCQPVRTIVQSLTVAAMEGHRDFYTPAHLVPRIGKTTVPLTDQTATLFCFDFDTVADQVAYLQQFDAQTTVDKCCNELDVFLRRKEAANKGKKAHIDEEEAA